MDLIAAKVKSPSIRISLIIMTYDVRTYQGDCPFKRTCQEKKVDPVFPSIH
jgi:hypothetical protein